MTIIAILIAIALCHFVRELGRFRNDRWLRSWTAFAQDAFGKLPAWDGVTGFVLLIALPLLGLLLVNQLLIAAFGVTGAFLLALAVLVYTFGPRDLDTEVTGIPADMSDTKVAKMFEDHDLAAVREQETVAEIARRYKIHPNIVYKWKRQLLDNAAMAFESNGGDGEGSQREGELLKKIGELTVERDFLAKRSAQLGLPAEKPW